MSRTAVATVTRLPDAHGQRLRTQRRIFGAAIQLLHSPTEVSMSTLAAHANIDPAALVACFPSVEAMFAELYLDRACRLPLAIDPAAPIATRVSQQLGALTLMLADEPRLARACTRALMNTDDDVIADVRFRIAAEVRRRIAAALGGGAWPEVVATLESVFWGALVQAQSGSMSYRQTAHQLETMVALITAR